MKQHTSPRQILFFSILSIVLMMFLSTTIPVAHAQPLMTQLQYTNEMSSLVSKEHDHHVKSPWKSRMVQKVYNILITSTPLITITTTEPRSHNTDFSHLPTHAEILFENYLQKPMAVSDDLWNILLQILSFIIELADFLYRAVEPFIVIIFTLLYAVNPPLAILFVVFMLVLRMISLLDIPSETTAVFLPT